MTWPETEAADPRLLLVPLGATEQHGPHLPLLTDAIIAEAWAAAVADRLPRAVVAPTLPFGSSGEHQGFPGTLSIGGPVLLSLVVELTRSAAETFDRLAFLSGHAGNDAALQEAMAQLRADGHDARHLIPTWPTDRFGPLDAHAGRTETSLLLHLRPDLVDRQAATAGQTRPLSEIMDRLVADGVRSLSPNGVLGDPAGASADEGRRLLDDLVERTIAELGDGRATPAQPLIGPPPGVLATLGPRIGIAGAGAADREAILSSDRASGGYGPETLAALREAVVGRSREAELVVAALMAGRHLLLEGPPGTGKSTLLRAVSDAAERDMEFVEGNADLTPARLAGHFDPAQVMEAGYTEDVWIDGPLVRALRDGHLLYLEEINRVPEETLNLLVTVMSEGELTVPRLGRIEADPRFRFVAAMNPFDAVGTARISGAIYDRVCRVAMGYQTPAEEADIAGRSSGLPPEHIAKVVEVVRATRDHSEVRVGSSVRGAIDLLVLSEDLARLRGLPPTDFGVGLDSALAALSGRIRLNDSTNVSPEEVVTELWTSILGPEPEANVDDGQQAGDAPGKAPRRRAAAPTPTATTAS